MPNEDSKVICLSFRSSLQFGKKINCFLKFTENAVPWKEFVMTNFAFLKNATHSSGPTPSKKKSHESIFFAPICTTGRSIIFLEFRTNSSKSLKLSPEPTM
ncbi:hypothetical protein D3C81_1842040 [compost metagenome]